MTINDKIKQILIDKQLSPSYFADEIGVQRSSISHILSGRNRPSFDIIQKIIRRFPDLGYEWIMEEEPSATVSFTGRQSSVPRANGVQSERTTMSMPSSASIQPTNAHGFVRSQRTEIPPISPPATYNSLDERFTDIDGHLSEETLQARKIERILIFYTDGSFREYLPS